MRLVFYLICLAFWICWHSLDTIMLAVHRLDRLVSGLLILARNASKADVFRQEVGLKAALSYVSLMVHLAELF